MRDSLRISTLGGSSGITVTLRCVDLLSHALLLLMVRHGWISSRALLAQED